MENAEIIAAIKNAAKVLGKTVRSNSLPPDLEVEACNAQFDLLTMIRKIQPTSIEENSLLEFLMALDRFGDFYVESKENGKYEVLMHGIRYPLVTFHTRLSHVSKCVLRFENCQPVGESGGRKLIWSDAHYTHGNQRDAYHQLAKYFSQFLE